MKFNALVPEFYVLDLQKSLDFYINILGFKIEYQRPPNFVFLSYLESQLMLQVEDDNEDWHNGKLEYPFGRGINFQIKTNDVQQIITRLANIKYPLKRGLQESWYQVQNSSYGYLEFLVIDPDGYLLRFSQPIK